MVLVIVFWLKFKDGIEELNGWMIYVEKVSLGVGFFLFFLDCDWVDFWLYVLVVVCGNSVVIGVVFV